MRLTKLRAYLLGILSGLVLAVAANGVYTLVARINRIEAYLQYLSPTIGGQ